MGHQFNRMHRVPPQGGGQFNANVLTRDPIMFPVINGVAHAPKCWYRGRDATATNWPAYLHGEDLPVHSHGSSAIESISDGMGYHDRQVVDVNGGERWKSGDSSFLDVGTQDMLISCSYRAPTVAKNIWGKRLSGPPNTGWAAVAFTNLLLMSLRDGTTVLSPQWVYPTEVIGDWIVFEAILDRDEASITYGTPGWVNGVKTAFSTTIASMGSFSNAGGFTLGSIDPSASAFTDDIGHFGLWYGEDMFPGGADNLTILDWAGRAALLGG